MPVGGRLCDDVIREQAARAHFLFGDDGLAQALGEILAEQPADDIGAAARREPDHESDRPLRVVLC